MTVHTTQLGDKTGHKSFRLTRGSGDQRTELHSDVVLSTADVRQLLAVAARRDVALGGTWSPGPAGVQLWSGPWDGPGGRVGSAVHLGSVDWSYDTPVAGEVTVYRVLLTASGESAGLTTHRLLDRVLALADAPAGAAAQAAADLPAPREPFRGEEWAPHLLTERQQAAPR